MVEFFSVKLLRQKTRTLRMSVISSSVWKSSTQSCNNLSWPSVDEATGIVTWNKQDLKLKITKKKDGLTWANVISFCRTITSCFFTEANTSICIVFLLYYSKHVWTDTNVHGLISWENCVIPDKIPPIFG